MHHGHHHHGESNARNLKRLATVLALVSVYLVAEVAGGVLSGSLALLADAGHMLSDVGALGLSLFALWISRRPPSARRTFGYYRAEILAALANGAALIAISIMIFIEAYRRLWQPAEVQGVAMMIVAGGGLVVNAAALWILGPGREHSLNLRGAWLHVLTDALGSVGALVAGALVWTAGWNWADTAASALIGLLVIYSAWRLVGEAVLVLMETAPGRIDVDEVRDAMISISGVMAIHDLHIWTITSGIESLSAHVVMEDGRAAHELLAQLRNALHDRFGIDHLTIQIEPADFD